MTISTIGNNGLALTSPLPVLQGGTGVTTSTGTGNNVLSTSPVLVTPNIGVATATSITGMSTPLSIAQGGTGFVDGTPMFRNRIINGGMVIDQRNAGASVTPISGTYTLDRWVAYQSTASKFSLQQNAGAVTPPVGFSNYLGCTSLSAYSVLVGDYYALRQSIEGFNTADFAWGTANASSVTLSFRVYSSLTGTFGGAVTNHNFTRAYPFTYSIPVASTWTTISITIAGDTTGTWLTNNGVGIAVTFSLGTGTTYSGTAGAWAASGYISATGAVSVVGTNGATFYITGVQLEKGSVATSFDYRPYGTELSLCQRYYEKSYDIGTAPGAAWALNGGLGIGTSFPTNNHRQSYPFKVPKRAVPTLTFYDATGASGKYSYYTSTWNNGGTTFTVNGACSTAIFWGISMASSIEAQAAYTASAEL